MISQNPTEAQTSQLGDAKAGAAGVSAAILNPRVIIEVASGGSGTTNDPAASDNKPPAP